MSMMATAALGITEITALIATIAAAFSAAARADRASQEESENPYAAARRHRRRALRAQGISRQASRIRPEYLPALARTRLLRARGLR